MSGMLLGVVLMMLNPSGIWKIYNPWGIEIPRGPSDQCEGLQTAVDYAILNGFSLRVLGGTQVGNGDPSRITCNASLWISAAAKTNIEMVGVSLAFPSSAAIDGIIFDSYDMLHFKLTGQIIYVGSSGAIKIRPITFFNEGNDQFKVATSSNIWIQSIAIVNSQTWQPESSHGYAVVIEPTAPITFNDIFVNEVNGGLGSLLVLPPSGNGNYNTAINKTVFNFVH
jgi:hypothetical protein